MPKKKSDPIDFGVPRGSKKEKRRLQTSRAVAVRQMVPPEAMVMFFLAVTSGFDPVLVPCALADSGWRVECKANGDDPSIETKMAAMNKLAEWGFGLPGTAKDVDASIRAAAPDEVKQLRQAFATQPAAVLDSLLGILTRALPSQVTVVDPPAAAPAPALAPEPERPALELESELDSPAGGLEAAPDSVPEQGS